MQSDTTWLGSASVGLIAAPFTPTVNSKVSDFTEANYTGYARQAAGVSSVPFVDPNLIMTVEGPALRFQPTDTITINSIYGLFLTGHDSTALLGVEMFDAPIPLPNPLAALTIVTRVGLQTTANFGFSLVSN